MGREQDREADEKELWKRYTSDPNLFGNFFGKLPRKDGKLRPYISSKYSQDIEEFEKAYNTLTGSNSFKDSVEFIEFLKSMEAMYVDFLYKCEYGVDGYTKENNPLYKMLQKPVENLIGQLDNVDLTRTNPVNEDAYLDISNLNNRLKATKSGFRGLFVRDTEKGVNMEKALKEVTLLAQMRKENPHVRDHKLDEYKKALEKLQTAANEYVDYKKGNVSGSVATERFSVAQGIGEFLKDEMARVNALIEKRDAYKGPTAEEKEIDDELEELDEEVKREKAGINQKKELTDEEVDKEYDEMNSEIDPEQDEEEYSEEVEEDLEKLQKEVDKEKEVKPQVKEETKKEEPKPEIKSDPMPQVKRGPTPKVAVQPKPQKLGFVQPKPQDIKPALPKKQAGLTGQTIFYTNANNGEHMKNIMGAKQFIRAAARGSRGFDPNTKSGLISAVRNVLAYELVSNSPFLAKNYSGENFGKLKTLITEQEFFKKIAQAINNTEKIEELTAVAETIKTRMVNSEEGNLEKGLLTKKFVQGIHKATNVEIANRKAEKEMEKTNVQEASPMSF